MKLWRWLRRWRRRDRVQELDRDTYPFDYIGPATAWGLTPGTPCRILRRAVGAGGRHIVTPAGRRWTVHIDHLERRENQRK